MAEEKGFEPLHRLRDLPVFKTGPFNQTWVFLQRLVPKAGLEPARGLARRILSPVRLPIPPLGQDQ